MVYTVTLNPALDYVMKLKALRTDDINRTDGEEIYYGGKGINVSVILTQLGIPNTALGFLGGFTGKKLEEIRANHVWKHRNSGEIPEDRFANRPAYINHTHDKSSRARNPSRYRSQAEKSNGHSYSR